MNGSRCNSLLHMIFLAPVFPFAFNSPTLPNSPTQECHGRERYTDLQISLFISKCGSSASEISTDIRCLCLCEQNIFMYRYSYINLVHLADNHGYRTTSMNSFTLGTAYNTSSFKVNSGRISVWLFITNTHCL